MATTSITRRFYVLLLALAVVLVGMVAKPFAAPLFFAAVLATALRPLYVRLERWFGHRPGLAAAVTVFLTVVAILLPTVGLLSILVREIIQVVNNLSDIVHNEGVVGLFHRLPTSLQDLAARSAQRFPNVFDRIEGAVAQGIGITAGLATELLQTTTRTLIHGVLLLIALFMFLTRGPQLLRWMEDISPLGVERTAGVFEELRKVSVSVLGSTVVVAAVQSLLALLSYVVAGVPNAVLLTFVTFFIALIPGLGATIAILAVGIVWAATGHLAGGIGLALWALFFVGMMDNVLKPRIIGKRGPSIDNGVMFFALLGGTAMFGPIGVLIGPMSVAFLLALTRMYQRERDMLSATPAAGPPPRPPESNPPTREVTRH